MLVSAHTSTEENFRMVDKVNYSTHDYDGEQTGFSINVADVTAANHDALVTAIGTLRAATVAITLGGIESSMIAEKTFNTPVVITDPLAQRESKWQVVVVEATTGRKYASTEIPMANLASFLLGGSPYIVKGGVIVGDDTGTEITDWIAAFEAIAKSPAGNALTVWDMYHVGANI